MIEIDKLNLVYNAAAHFAAQDRFPEDKYPDGISSAIFTRGFEGFENTCWMLALLEAQGELVRRDMGHDRREVYTEEHWKNALLSGSIHQVNAIRSAILAAMSKGLRRPGEEDEEVDEVLMELQKKTETGPA